MINFTGPPLFFSLFSFLSLRGREPGTDSKLTQQTKVSVCTWAPPIVQVKKHTKMLTTFCSHFTKPVRGLHQYSHTVDGNDGHTKHTSTSKLGRGGGGGKGGRESQQSICIAIKTKGRNLKLLASCHKTYLTY